MCFGLLSPVQDSGVFVDGYSVQVAHLFSAQRAGQSSGALRCLKVSVHLSLWRDRHLFMARFVP